MGKNSKRKKSYPSKTVDKKYTSTQSSNQEKDQNSELWNDFNKHPLKKRKTTITSKKEWIAPSSMRHSLMDDPCTEWLKLYYVTYGIKNNRENVSEKKGFLTSHFGNDNKNTKIKMGLEFEDLVMDDISKRFPEKFEVISEYVYPSLELMEKTMDCMKTGVPFIGQAVLYNFKNKTYGTVDLLVRSDWINQLFNENILSEEEIGVPSPVLNKKYHYRVIDIKCSTLQLCADGKRIRNSSNISYYKGQLAIYNAALGLMQGYTPNQAYILCRGWKYTSKKRTFNGFDCFERPGQIEFNEFDKQHIQKTTDCIQYVRDLRYDGPNWKCIPPSNENMYPNMKNKYDTPYHDVKKKIANEIGELTTLWYVSPKNRRIAHSKGVYRRDDPKLSSKVLEIKGKRGMIIDEIIKTNRDSKKTVRPEVIKRPESKWDTPMFLDFYIDLETFSEIEIMPIDIHNSKMEHNIIFCIGAGYEENGKWVHKKFYMDDYDPEEGTHLENEKKMLDEFFNFVIDRTDKYTNKYKPTDIFNCVPRFFHWAHAEPTVFGKANERHGFEWGTVIETVEWIDLYKEFVKIPITVKGSYRFDLKSVAKAFYKNDLISTIWNDDIIDGYQVVVEIGKYFNFMNKYKRMTSSEKSRNRREYRHQQQIFQSILKYNEVDCKVMWEIVTYLRNHNCNQSDFVTNLIY